MAWLQNGTAVTNAGGTTTTVTVPAGITAANTCIFTLSTAAGAAAIISTTPSSNNGSAVVTTMVPLTGVQNSNLSVFSATGLVASDTFTITTGANSSARLSHFYFDTDMATIGTVGTRGGVSQNFVIAPTTTVAAGSKIYVYGMSRITIANAFSSIVNSNGRTLTQRYSDYTTTNPAVNVNLYEFTEPTTATGTTTLTETANSTNAAIFHFAEALSVSIPLAWYQGG